MLVCVTFDLLYQSRQESGMQGFVGGARHVRDTSVTARPGTLTFAHVFSSGWSQLLRQNRSDSVLRCPIPAATATTPVRRLRGAGCATLPGTSGNRPILARTQRRVACSAYPGQVQR